MRKTIVITGATSGIGQVAAIRLAEQGARIVFVARDKVRADATLAKLKGEGHAYHLADLSLVVEQKRVAHAIAAAEPQIDVLINNAGALFNHRHETTEGLERTFALNHMSYFTLTDILRERLKPGARIVNVASAAHRRGRLDLSDLQSRNNFSGFIVYSTTKLLNILFTRALAKRLTGVTANCLHPGFVATGFGDGSGGWMERALVWAKKLVAITPEKGAKTIVYLATSPDVEDVSGEYFYKCKRAVPTSAARSDADAEKLWQASEAIAASR